MKRFLLFQGDYYPAGGWQDFREDFDTLEEALYQALGMDSSCPTTYDWSHIVDTQPFAGGAAVVWEK